MLDDGYYEYLFCCIGGPSYVQLRDENLNDMSLIIIYQASFTAWSYPLGTPQKVFKNHQKLPKHPPQLPKKSL